MFASGSPLALFKWEALFRDSSLFLHGFAYTLFLSAGALVLAITLGVIFGMMSASRWAPLRIIARAYVEFIQNTPLLIQVFFLFNGLPLLGLILNVTVIGIAGVGIYHGAYISEVVRAGVQSTHSGQFDAAYSQGFEYSQAMRYIILPQALKVMLPPLTNQTVNLIKNTSVIAIISGADIMFTAKSWSGANLYYAPAYIAAGLLYFILCFPLTKLAVKLEERAKSLVVPKRRRVRQ